MHQKAIFYLFQQSQNRYNSIKFGFLFFCQNYSPCIVAFLCKRSFYHVFLRWENEHSESIEGDSTVLFNTLLLFYQGYSQGRLFKTNARQKNKREHV